MEVRAWIDYCLDNLPGTVSVDSWGERGIFYNPDGKLRRGVYVATIKEKDGENDAASRLDRPGTYCINIGLRKQTFIHMFGALPARPKKGSVVDMPFDFSETDVILPHPVYAWMGWIRVIDPSAQTFERCKPLLMEAYVYAQEKWAKRKESL